MSESENNLSKTRKMIVEYKEDYVVITYNGKSLVKVVPYKKSKSIKIGILSGMYNINFDDFNKYDSEMKEMFYDE